MEKDTDFSLLVAGLLALPDFNLAKLGAAVGLSAQAIMRLRDGEVTDPAWSVGQAVIVLDRRYRRRIDKLPSLLAP